MSMETDAKRIKGTNHLCRANTNVKAGILLQVSSQFSDKIMLSRFPHHCRSVQPPRLPAARQWKVNGRGGTCRWWCNIVPRMSGLLAPLFSSSQGDYTVEGKAVLPGRRTFKKNRVSGMQKGKIEFSHAHIGRKYR